MKLFQQLLVAPAALGLLAPMAATAAELNINGVSNYSASSEEVKSISQFSDVYPTDWAYQALTNLAERHGCAAANPSGSMTRYEAAALLNTCLGEVAQVNEEERRLINEFGPELAVIKGRLDGLEAQMGGFEAGMFSTTTKLNGKIVFNTGAVDRDESTEEATVFQYVATWNLNTSFNGEDLLYTRIKTGNGSGPFSSKTYGTYLSNNNGNADTIFFGLPLFPVLQLVSQGFETEYKRACPSCKLKTVPIDIMDLINGKVPQVVISELQVNPNANWIPFAFGGMLFGVPEALDAVDLASRVSSISQAGGPLNCIFIDNGAVQVAEVGLASEYLG